MFDRRAKSGSLRKGTVCISWLLSLFMNVPKRAASRKANRRLSNLHFVWLETITWFLDRNNIVPRVESEFLSMGVSSMYNACTAHR